MKLFGVICLAGLLSLIVGIGVTAAVSAIAPCYSDKAGCGMGEAYRLFVVPVYAIAGMIGFGISAAGKNRERALWLTLITLALVAVFLFLFAIGADMSSGHSTTMSDASDALQAAVSYWAVILVQWRLIRDYLRRRVSAQVAA